ncbi:MAG: glycosyl hydrolase, partial [Chloroflexota bacterium]
MKNKILFLLLLISQILAAQELRWPETNSETKPWTRMWWMASIGTKQDLTSALEKYSKAGIGGVEVTCIYGVKGQEDKFVDYLSPEWMDKFIHILHEGKRLGLGIDLANASGWPFGGPWVNPEDACRNINYKTYTLKEGEKL